MAWFSVNVLVVCLAQCAGCVTQLVCLDCACACACACECAACVPCSPASRCRGTCPQHKGGGEGDGGERYLEIEKNMKRKTTASLKREKKENGKKKTCRG